MKIKTYIKYIIKIENDVSKLDINYEKIKKLMINK